ATLEPLLLRDDLCQATTSTRVAALLEPATQNQQRSKAAAREELLVREPGADAALRQHARSHPNQACRLLALAAIERRPATGNHQFVLRTAAVDRSEIVRKNVIDIVRARATDDDVQYLAAGLAHSASKVRTRTAVALGRLGKPSAIEHLVKAGPVAAVGLASGGDGTQTRGHVAFLTQRDRKSTRLNSSHV